MRLKWYFLFEMKTLDKLCTFFIKYTLIKLKIFKSIPSKCMVI